MPLLEPKEISVKTLKGDDRIYVISKFPAIAGREIIAKYPTTAIPKLAEYSQNEEIMTKLMGYVAVNVADGKGGKPPVQVLLTTKALIDNHVPDWETLVKIEIEVMKYNTSFFDQGVVSDFFASILQNLMSQITPTLIPWSERLLQKIRQRLENSKKSTH